VDAAAANAKLRIQNHIDNDKKSQKQSIKIHEK
jgi:hypothetical protein